jgi:putative oxidoreductase
MTNLDSLRRTRALALKVTGALAFLAPLLTRLLMGQAFYQTGAGKIANFANTASFFADLGLPFPEVNAFIVSRLEFWGGLLLVVGLATRLLAGALATTMIVALATADRASLVEAWRGSGDTGLTDVVPLVYLLFLTWLVLVGPGAVSLDRVLVRWFDRPKRTSLARPTPPPGYPPPPPRGPAPAALPHAARPPPCGGGRGPVSVILWAPTPKEAL